MGQNETLTNLKGVQLQNEPASSTETGTTEKCLFDKYSHPVFCGG